jgi:hypothetical protein
MYFRAYRARKQHILVSDNRNRTLCGKDVQHGARYEGTETTSDRKFWPTCTGCRVAARGLGVR